MTEAESSPFGVLGIRPSDQNGGPRFPREINESFILVNVWSTDLRYVAGSLRDEESEGFLAAAANIMRLADGRL